MPFPPKNVKYIFIGSIKQDTNEHQVQVDFVKDSKKMKFLKSYIVM
jgi:hypothetical protein